VKREGPQPTKPGAPSKTREGASDFTRLLGLQRHEPLTREDREDLDFLVAAAERGFRLATRCTRCNQWLVAHKSVALHLGPVCRTKAAAG
jgi:uncharacterized protein DUF6011